MSKEILRYADVECKLKLDRVTIWRLVKNDDSFPKPYKLGKARNSPVGFIAQEIDDWLDKQARVC